MRNIFCAVLLSTFFTSPLYAEQSSSDTVLQEEFQTIWQTHAQENPPNVVLNDAIREVCHGRASANDYGSDFDRYQELVFVEKSRDVFLAPPFEYEPTKACSAALSHYLRDYFIQ